MEESKQEGKPFFLWWNSTRMHIWTRLKAESQGKTGLGIYPDGMVEHDAMVGQILDKLKELGLEENTIVMYSTDNGAEKFTWPDGGQSPFRGEKNTNWEGGYRVPCADPLARRDQARHGPQRHLRPRGHAAHAAGGGGRPGREGKAPEGHEGRQQDLQGAPRRLQHHRRPGRASSPSPRHEFFYFNDEGSLVGLRYDQWKIVFAEQREHGLNVWQEPFVPLRFPKLFNLRSDPFETADHEGMDYERWRVEHVFVLVPAQQYVGKFLATFKEFPPSQKPGSFSIDRCWRRSSAGRRGEAGSP